MPRLGWMTDIHLNFLSDPDSRAFLDRVRGEDLDAVLIGGDISESPTLEHHLTMIANHLPCPVYFVLGNHDFYHSSVAATRGMVRAVCQAFSNLHWLSQERVITISEQTALIGHDGWADGRNGDFIGSETLLNDFFLIQELRDAGNLSERLFVEDSMKRGKLDLLKVLETLAEEAADHFRCVLPQALESHRKVVLLTHVPPYREASWYDGRISSDDWLPHMSSRIAGETLSALMPPHPDKQLMVLCGHTHGSGQVQIAPNIFVKTGGARYGQPEIQEVFHI